VVAAALLVASCAWPGVAGEVKPGDATEIVVNVLGDPDGYMKVGASEWYFYHHRGEVHAAHGRVTLVKLIPEEEAQALRIEQERLRQERQQERRREGEALRADRLSDPVFAMLPAAERAALWYSFRTRYPEVDVSVPFAAARAEAARDAERARMEQRVAELERRVQEAETRVRRAELTAAQTRSAGYYGQPVSYPVYIDYAPYAISQRSVIRPVSTVVHRRPSVEIRYSPGHHSVQFRSRSIELGTGQIMTHSVGGHSSGRVGLPGPPHGGARAGR